MSALPGIVKNDPWLKPFESVIRSRSEKVQATEKMLVGKYTLPEFANGHLFFGLHRSRTGWIFREWAPNASEIFLVGEFSGWQEQPQFQLAEVENGIWEIIIPPDILHHGMLYRLSVHWEGGQGNRIPAYATRVVQDLSTHIFNAQVWSPEHAFTWKHPHFKRSSAPPLIYEAHVGMATEEEKVGSYREFREDVLPRIIKSGYNTLQLMAIQEHPYYGSFGYHVSNFFAASSRFGTPEDLKALVDAAHGAGMAVIMDLVHSHSVKNEIEGLGKFDGTPYQYFHDGVRGLHPAWDSLCFNYGKPEVLHFLLSNCKFWLEEYHFDGFRFDGVTSMLYYDHGLSKDFTSYDQYFDGQQDEDALAYLSLANKLIHHVKPEALTVAEEMSGMPGLAADEKDGGMGFDFRLAMGTPDYWIKLIKEVPDEQWPVDHIFNELSSHRADEKTIGYAESHDQALVGDKTIIFRLLDKEMYDHMNKSSQSLIIDRGMALHKMIRLATLAAAGGGYLNFMGNEFGHPEWIDFPREGNQWSYKYARRQWSLVDNPDLRYHVLRDFDRAMIQLIRSESILSIPFPYKWLAHETDQMLIFERGSLTFLFNFHPSRSYTDYGIQVPPGKYELVLNSDSPQFGGYGNVEDHQLYYTRPQGKITSSLIHYLTVYIPSRTALVLKKLPIRTLKDLS